MENKEYNTYLKKIEEDHSKKFKNDKDYLEGCKANKNLNPKDYKIISNHKLDEYFNKYGKKLESGKLLAYKKDELWLMNKKTTYWEIKNDSDFIYFEVFSNIKPLWILGAYLLTVGALATGSYFLGVFMNKGNGNENENASQPLRSLLLIDSRIEAASNVEINQLYINGDTEYNYVDKGFYIEDLNKCGDTLEIAMFMAVNGDNAFAEDGGYFPNPIQPDTVFNELMVANYSISNDNDGITSFDEKYYYPSDKRSFRSFVDSYQYLKSISHYTTGTDTERNSSQTSDLASTHNKLWYGFKFNVALDLISERFNDGILIKLQIKYEDTNYVNHQGGGK